MSVRSGKIASFLLVLSFLSVPFAEADSANCPQGKQSTSELTAELHTLLSALVKYQCSETTPPEAASSYRDFFQNQNVLAYVGCDIPKQKPDLYQSMLTSPGFSQCKCPKDPNPNYDILLCKNDGEVVHLSNQEFETLFSYMGSGYASMNSALRSEDKTEICPKKGEISVLEKTLMKFPVFHGDLYRGIGRPPQELLDHHQVGKVVEYPAFTSTSSDQSVARAFAAFYGWNFVIHANKACFDVRILNPGENEVICEPGTRFRIDTRDDTTRTITMTEVTETGR